MGAGGLGRGAFAGACLVASAALAAEPGVYRYLSVRLSPDGTTVASVEGEAPPGASAPDVRRLVIRRDGHEPLTIALPCAAQPHCWPGSPVWLDAQHLLFTLRLPDTHEYGLYEVAADGAGLRERLRIRGALSDLRVGPHGEVAVLAIAAATKETGATEPGSALAGDLDAAPPEQRIALVDADQLHWVSPPTLFVYEYDWRPDGSGFVATAAPGDGDDNWWHARLYAFDRRGESRVLYQPPARRQLAAPSVSPDGRRVVFIGGLMSDFGSTGGDVFELGDSGVVRNLTDGWRASAAALTWSCDGHLLAQLLTDGETELTDLADRAAGAHGRVLWHGPQTVNLADAGPLACPGGGVAVSHESYTSPPEIAVGPIGHWRDVTSLNAALHSRGRAQLVNWRRDGLQEQGWLMLPPGPGPFPMITVVHGGPAAAAEPYFYGPGLQERLLERGYALFRPNPRGSFGQGEAYTLANVREFGHADLADILAGIDAAERVAPIDEHRLGITGGSYGGFMTMWAVTQTQRFKAAVAAAGISNWQSYYGENGIDQWMLPYFGASVYQDPAIYARSSAINFITHVRTPTFVYVGERDIECPAVQTQEFWHALRELGVPTGIMIYPGEGHRLRDPAHAADAVERTLAWFDRYLR